MKIKTVKKRLDNADLFDKEVNAALDDGWRLVRREVLPGGPLTATEYAYRMLYAEMVKMDEPQEPAPLDPMAAARTLKAFCDTVCGEECREDRCPMAALCDQIKHGYTPESWLLPAEEPHATE